MSPSTLAATGQPGGQAEPKGSRLAERITRLDLSGLDKNSFAPKTKGTGDVQPDEDLVLLETMTSAKYVIPDAEAAIAYDPLHAVVYTHEDDEDEYDGKGYWDSEAEAEEVADGEGDYTETVLDDGTVVRHEGLGSQYTALPQHLLEEMEANDTSALFRLYQNIERWEADAIGCLGSCLGPIDEASIIKWDKGGRYVLVPDPQGNIEDKGYGVYKDLSNDQVFSRTDGDHKDSQGGNGSTDDVPVVLLGNDVMKKKVAKGVRAARAAAMTSTNTGTGGDAK